MLFSKPCRFVLFSAFLLTGFANAESIRGVQQRELAATGDVNLGTAGSYAILTKAGITTVSGSDIEGDIAVSPIAATAMTGFGLTSSDVGKASTSSQVTGKAYAANYIAPTPALLTTAVGDLKIAYRDAEARLNPNGAKINYKGGEIGGETLSGLGDGTDAIYTFQSDVTISNDVIFDGSDSDGNDNPNQIFIIQTTGDVMIDADKKVRLIGGAQAKNIFWQVAGKVTVLANAHMEGIILVKTHISFLDSSSLNGRVFAQTACNLMKATIDARMV